MVHGPTTDAVLALIIITYLITRHLCATTIEFQQLQCRRYRQVQSTTHKAGVCANHKA